jgi:TP901 family phage tail tape measure protein
MGASAGAIRAGLAYVEVGANNNALVSGLKAAEAKIRAFGNSVKAIGMQAIAASAAMAVPLGFATKIYADFEQNMARTRGLLNLEKTSAQFRALEAEAAKLGATTVYTAGQAAEAMSYFAQSGYSTEQILKATGPTLQLAATGMMDLKTAADISMKVMSGMQIESSQLGRVVDILAKTMTTANTDLLQLGEAFKFVGPIANAAGVSLEEVSAAIQILSNAGIQGEMAGTTMRGAILSLASPSQEASLAMKQLGISAMDSRGKFKSIVEIVESFEKAMGKMEDGQRLMWLGKIFPDRQAANFTNFIGKSGELRERTAAITASTGESARVSGAQLDTLFGAWKLLESALEGVALIIGKALAPTLREWGQALVDGLGVLSKIVDGNKEWIPIIGKTIVAVGAVGVGLVALGGTVNLLAFAIGGIGTAVALVTGAVGALLSPLGLLTAGVAGLGYHWLTATESGKQAMTAMGKQIQWLGGIFSESWKGITDAVMAGDLELAARVAWVGLRQVWDAGIGFLNDAWLSFIEGFSSAFRLAIGAVAKQLNSLHADIQSLAVETESWGEWAAGEATFGLFGGADKDREKKRIEGHVEIERRKNAIEQEMAADDARQADQRKRDAEARGVARDADIAQARAELAAAVKQAEMERAIVDAGRILKDMEATGEVDVNGKKVQIPNGDTMARDVQSRVQGTFRGDLIEQMFGSDSDIPKKQLKVQEQQLAALLKTIEVLRNGVGGVLFK